MNVFVSDWKGTLMPCESDEMAAVVAEFGNPILNNRDREGIPDIRLKFRFPSLIEFSKIQKGTGDFLVSALIEPQEDIFPLAEINLSKIDVNPEAKELTDNNSGGFLTGGEFREESIPDCCKTEKLGLDFVSGFGENQGLPEHLGDDFLTEEDFDDQRNEAEFVKDTDSNRMETLWEHQELIEQLKMELRKVRATGLPTILEESESPTLTDEVKPWKIDDGILRYEDCMDEVGQLCNRYREMMRRLDILNYQKMYAMGFLQLKDPFQQVSHQRPTLGSLVAQNLWLFKHRRSGSDPTKKFVSELQGDLEVVYVGQTCLSWEFLRWQYEKALDLWSSDPNGIRRYNEIAGEFQQFQVLVQRFMEDEPFQGPRIQSYIKRRCILRNLLQVPAIRGDEAKDKNIRTKDLDNNQYIVTSKTLVEIVESLIQTLWQFIRSDKDCGNQAMNVRKKTPELHNPQDLKLLLQVRKTLQKMEKKVKERMRSEKCILRKFHNKRRRNGDEDSDQILKYFIAEVEIKLVSRVLNMSRVTRDQLIWCQNKLGIISFSSNRKIHLQPSAVLFFPC